MALFFYTYTQKGALPYEAYNKQEHNELPHTLEAFI